MSHLSQNSKKYSILATLFIVLGLLFLYLVRPIEQEPLVQLSTDTVNKFIARGVSNIVFFDKDAKPSQVLDLFHEKPPQVRSTVGAANAFEKNKTQVNASKKLSSNTNYQEVNLKELFKPVANAKKPTTPQKEQESLVSLAKEQILDLIKKDIYYIEYRDVKDQQIQVLEFTDEGVCIPCLKSSLPKSPYQNIPTQNESGNSILNFVIPAAEACHTNCGCRSHHCKDVSTACCNCK